MLSICIPIYNINVRPLVWDLLDEQSGVTVPIEIILIDDCSTESYRAANSNLPPELVKYVQLDRNIGRARTRNEFLKYARYNNLLFLDSDSLMISLKFLATYIAEIGGGAKVVCGGRIYSTEEPPKPYSPHLNYGRKTERKQGAVRMEYHISSNEEPPKAYRLHWNYGRNTESKPAAVRMEHPYRSFMTNNFMVEKSVLASLPFNAEIKGYGHEDTLFGYELKKHNINIKHIENPVYHGQLQDNAEFLAKSEEALVNLNKVLQLVNNDPLFIEDVTLLRYYFSLKRSGLLFLARIIYALLKPLLRSLLLNGHSGFGIFSFYKLGYFGGIYKP